MIALGTARDVLERARAAHAFSAVSAEVGSSAGARWVHAAGTLGFDTAATVTPDTIFDLASLTKVLSTTSVALPLVARGALDVETRVADRVPAWTGAHRHEVTIRDLLEHCSGLPAYREYFRELRGREAYTAVIASEPLEYAPRTQAIYSDLGFMLLGFVLEDVAAASLDQQFDAWRDALRVDAPIAYRPPAAWIPRTAMTENDPWRGRVLQGDVHDENAAALGGVAAHAGLFGTAAAVGGLARWWLRRLRGEDDERLGIPAALVRRFAARSRVPGSSRALGWDTMLPTSSCGERLSRDAIGHTGFTGTSLWIDPERDAYFVLLTNRVHPSRANNAIGPVRRQFHEAAVADLVEAR